MRVCWSSFIRNWESDRVRPEVTAFRELDTLVRNLGDQLAGYRRRALSAEARTRELEQRAESLDEALQAARAEAVVAHTARSTLQVQIQELAQRELTARSQLERAHIAFAAATEAATPQAVESELARENQRLRARLAEAHERTGQLADRVRFLRQQTGLGAER